MNFTILTADPGSSRQIVAKASGSSMPMRKVLERNGAALIRSRSELTARRRIFFPRGEREVVRIFSLADRNLLRSRILSLFPLSASRLESLDDSDNSIVFRCRSSKQKRIFSTLIGGTSEKGGSQVLSIFRYEKLASIVLSRTPSVDRKLNNFFPSCSSIWNISNFSRAFEKL